jgi:phosphoglucosamine mutase
MITASHNPYEYNGIKVFSPAGGKLPDAAEERLNYDIESGVPDRPYLDHSGLDPESINKNADELAKEYEDFLFASAGGIRLDGMRIAVDTANGAASGVGQRIFERLGAEVIALGNTPDGRNINVNCGATSTAALSQTVSDQDCEFGVAVDGDADRIMMVDNLGRECTGDHLMYLLAVGNGYDHIVATVMTNLGAEQSLAARGVSLDRTAVGDRYVLERLLETNYRLGGEQSGHIILPELTTTGDGLLAAIQVVRVLKTSGKTLSAWRDEVTILPQALVNFRIEDKTRLNSPEVTAVVEAETAALDGTGRILVRPSGTEPLARVMVEAPDALAKAETIAAHIQELVQ